MSLVIEASRPTVELGEPVYLTARLLNNGNAAISLWSSLDPQDGQLSISVLDPGKRSVGFVPLSVRDSDAPPITLQPGRQVAKSFPVFFGATGWVFRTPGRYTIRARYDLRVVAGFSSELEASAVFVDVKEGDPRIARALDASAASLQAGRFMEWRGGDHLLEGKAMLEDVASAVPDSALANHYRLAAGRSWVRPFKDYRRNEVRPADPTRALAELGRVREGTLPLTVSVEKRMAEATALLELNRLSDVPELLARVRAAVNERPELREYDEQLSRLEQALNRLRR